jgi:hypothetical protein
VDKGASWSQHWPYNSSWSARGMRRPKWGRTRLGLGYCTGCSSQRRRATRCSQHCTCDFSRTTSCRGVKTGRESIALAVARPGGSSAAWHGGMGLCCGRVVERRTREEAQARGERGVFFSTKLRREEIGHMLCQRTWGGGEKVGGLDHGWRQHCSVRKRQAAWSKGIWPLTDGP